MSDAASSERTGYVAAVERFVFPGDDAGSRWRAPLTHTLQVGWAVGRDMTEGQITLRAMSLVYTTLLSLVPLLAISFSILKGFGVHNQIEPFLTTALEPLGERRDEIVGQIIGFVDNIQVGVLGSVGFLLLFYTVVSLMQKIELAFNEVWQISKRRSLTERFKDYLSVVVVGPVLIFASLGITAAVMSDPLMARISSIGAIQTVIEWVGRLVPIAMVSLAFTFIYMFVPNTRVRILPAMTGGLVAGILWNALGWAFAAFVAQASRYTAIYSGFATPILFMIWLYVGWLILLVGATIAFYRQHPEYLAGRRLARHLSAADRDRLALHAICAIGERFYHGGPAPNADDIAHDLRVPAQALEEVMTALESRGLVASTDATPPTFLPGCPWESASVHDVLDVTQHAHHGAVDTPAADPDLDPRIDDRRVMDIMKQRRRISADSFGSLTLKQLICGKSDQA
jgi:membrane protein